MYVWRGLVFAVIIVGLTNLPGCAQTSVASQGVMVAYQQLQRGDARAAIGTLKAALKADPGNGDARRLLGVALLREGQGVLAVQVLEGAVRQEPDNAMGVSLLGDAYAGCGSGQAAVSCYARALRQAPGLSQATVGLARAYLLAGEPDRAQNAARQGLEKSPAPETRRQLLRILEKAQQVQVSASGQGGPG
jgi:Tfp pilus assembly protein PilF